VADLVAGATERTPLEQSEGKSGAILERVVIDGAPFVLKTVDRRHDWIMRRPRRADGWARLPHRSPDLASLVLPLLAEPWPFFDALAREPRAFLHGDWKLGNLGSDADGRTILVDWSMPWSGPPCADLVHYVVLNQARLPVGHRKEDAFDAYRHALVAQGIETEPWFEGQLALCILGAMLQLGWEKALGDDAELAWWSDRARDGARYLAGSTGRRRKRRLVRRRPSRPLDAGS
jgi:hypothetical protein